MGWLHSVKWWNYKAVRRNRLMQSCLTDLPAIQTGMLVVSAVTFHSTGSEVRPRPTAAAAAVVKLRLHGNFSLQSDLLVPTVTFPNRRSGSSAADSSDRNLTWSRFAVEKSGRFVCTYCFQWANTEGVSVEVHHESTNTQQSDFFLKLKPSDHLSYLIDVDLQPGLSDGLSVCMSSQC